VGVSLKNLSDAANKIPPAVPTAGRMAQFDTKSWPTDSFNNCWFQFSILVSWRHTIVAPEDVIKLRTLALFAPSLSPLTFQHSIEQSFYTIKHSSTTIDY